MDLFIYVVFYPLIWLDLILGDQIFAGGPIYSMLILLFMDCCTDSEGYFSVCGITFFLPKKYLPIMVLLACFFFFRANIFMFGFILLLQLYQFGCRQKPLFALPIRVYFAINRCVPECIRNFRGWVDCDGVKDNLESRCNSACRQADN